MENDNLRNKANKVALTLWDRLTYAIGSMGFCLMFMTIGGYLLYTYTDVFYINPVTAANIFLFTRFWDAINDPIMGMIVDKRPFAKKGKGVYRPWLLIAAPILAVTFALSFTMPSFITTETGKVFWAIALYVLYTMAQTLGQVPFGSMSNALTTDSRERGLLGSYRNFGENIASFVVSLVIMALVGFFGKDGANGWSGAAWVIGIAGAICLLVCYFNSKETAVVNETEGKAKVGLKESFAMLIHNRPTICMIFGLFVAAVVINFRFAYMMYYCNYYLSDIPNAVTVVNSVQTAVSIFSFWVVNWMFKHLEKKQMLIIAGVLFAVDGAISLIAQHNYVLVIVSAVLFGFLMALSFSTIWGSVPDGVEYGLWKTGVCAPAFVFAMVTFAQKCGIGIASWLAATSLSMIGYVAGETVSEATAYGFYAWNGWVLVIGGILFAAIGLFYNLSNQKYCDIVKEIDSRCATKAVEAAEKPVEA